MDSLVKKVCKLCGTFGSIPVFEGQIRAGSPGSMTDHTYSVMECPQCGVQYLEPFPVTGVDFYETGNYRQAYDNTTDVHAFLGKYDDDQPPRIERIGISNLRGKVIGDFGCGGGSFLDLVRGVAKQTIAIEPFQDYHSSLVERGHRVFQWGREVPESMLGLAVSFDVIEHVEDPIAFLKEIYSALKPGGVAYIATPNRNEILMQLHAERYTSFYYRTAHLWYFDAGSLAWAARQAGFPDVEVTYYHKYDLSNAFCWLRDNRPTGVGKIDLFDERLDHQWRGFLEEKGWADNLWMVARKEGVLCQGFVLGIA